MKFLDWLRFIKYSYYISNGVKKDRLSKYEVMINQYQHRCLTFDERATAVLMDTTSRDPIVSVVTPSFNAATFLPGLAESLRQQTISKEIQWVIVDDGSTDETEEVVRNIAKEHRMLGIKYIKIGANCGAAFALSKGFEEADAAFVAWVSADDSYVDPLKLEKDIELLKGGFDIVFSRYTLYGPNQKQCMLFETSLPSKDKEQLFVSITLSDNLNGSSVVLKKAAYVAAGGFDKCLLNVDADYDLFARMILNGFKVGLSDSTTFVRIHPKRTSANRDLMAFGTSISRSRFLLIPPLYRFLTQTFQSRKLEFYRLGVLAPIFFFEVLKNAWSEGSKSELNHLDLIFFRRTKELSNFFTSYDRLVHQLCQTHSFRTFFQAFQAR